LDFTFGPHQTLPCLASACRIYSTDHLFIGQTRSCFDSSWLLLSYTHFSPFFSSLFFSTYTTRSVFLAASGDLTARPDRPTNPTPLFRQLLYHQYCSHYPTITPKRCKVATCVDFETASILPHPAYWNTDDLSILSLYCYPLHCLLPPTFPILTAFGLVQHFSLYKPSCTYEDMMDESTTSPI